MATSKQKPGSKSKPASTQPIRPARVEEEQDAKRREADYRKRDHELNKSKAAQETDAKYSHPVHPNTKEPGSTSEMIAEAMKQGS